MSPSLMGDTLPHYGLTAYHKNLVTDTLQWSQDDNRMDAEALRQKDTNT